MLSRRKRRTDSGAKTAQIKIGHTIAIKNAFSLTQAPPPSPGLPNNSRFAVTVADIGFHSADRVHQHEGDPRRLPNPICEIADGDDPAICRGAPKTIHSRLGYRRRKRVDAHAATSFSA
jgi:hypothetical protein